MTVRLLSLLIPACASGLGFFCFSVLAFGFTELAGLPEAFRRSLVLVGAFALAFGAEVGTLSSVVEIYRKGERLGRWDKAALVVSVLATFGAFVLSFAELLGARATWGAVVQLYGPVVLGLLAALDSYGGFMELGLYLHRRDSEERARISTDLQFKIWYAKEQAQARRQLREIEMDAMGDTQPIAVPAQPAATIAQPTAQLAAQPQPEAQLAAQPEAQLGKRVAIVRLYRNNPRATQAQVAEAVGCSRAYVGDVLKQLAATGAIKRNGNGVEFTSEEE